MERFFHTHINFKKNKLNKYFAKYFFNFDKEYKDEDAVKYLSFKRIDVIAKIIYCEYFLNITPTNFNRLLHMIGILSFAFSYTIVDKNKIKLTFDNENEITIPTKNLSYEDDNLLELLFGGIKYGANFIFGNEGNRENLRDKTI